jgi:starch synthase
MPESLRVAIVASEMAPFAKTGGLADVVGALPKALARLGHGSTVFLPRYARIESPPGELAGTVHVPLGVGAPPATFFVRSESPGVRIVFVDQPGYFDRPKLYGNGNDDYVDNAERFAFLCRAALEFYRSRAERPDVFHAHDWQAGLLPVYLKAFYWNDPVLGRCPTLFTIHNQAYQGNFPLGTLSSLGLPWHLATPGGLEYYGGINYLKAGILFSELVSTVSPTYAQQIQRPDHGLGLDGVLRSRAGDLFGILNGVDEEVWDPRRDSHIAARYSPKDLTGKGRCKRDLQEACGLPADPDLPLVGIVSRLVAQKGFDIVVGAWYDFLHRPLRMVVLGTGEPDVEAGFRALVERAPLRFAVRLAYDEDLAHKIVAGSDMLLMPSRFEPCGLPQLYAQRYGTIPIVRATGGLADSVAPYHADGETGTGFLFEHADGTGLVWALDQALATYADPAAWRRLMLRGMAQDFSWERAARSYVELYRLAITKA